MTKNKKFKQLVKKGLSDSNNAIVVAVLNGKDYHMKSCTKFKNPNDVLNLCIDLIVQICSNELDVNVDNWKMHQSIARNIAMYVDELKEKDGEKNDK